MSQGRKSSQTLRQIRSFVFSHLAWRGGLSLPETSLTLAVALVMGCQRFAIALIFEVRVRARDKAVGASHTKCDSVIVEGWRVRAAFRIRPAVRKIDQNPHSSRSFDVRFGARLRVRRWTISCCLRRGFSAVTAALHQSHRALRSRRPCVAERAGGTSCAGQRRSDEDAGQCCRILDSTRESPIRVAQAFASHSARRRDRFEP
jgi:hypothetical protein